MKCRNKDKVFPIYKHFIKASNTINFNDFNSCLLDGNIRSVGQGILFLSALKFQLFLEHAYITNETLTHSSRILIKSLLMGNRKNQENSYVTQNSFKQKQTNKISFT